ncbi:hypothetical protein V8E55_006655 [Tylopilus felleus]
MFHAPRATAFAGQANTSCSGEFNTTALSETTMTSSLSTSVPTHASASAPSSKLLRTTAIGMSGRRSSSSALFLALTRSVLVGVPTNGSGRDFVGVRMILVEACTRFCKDVAIDTTSNLKALSGC